MARGKKDINLLDALEGKKKVGLSHRALLGLACIPLVALLAVATTLYLATTIAELSGQRDSLKSYVQSSQTQAARQEAADVERQAQQNREKADALITELYNISSYPDLYGEEYNRIFELSGYGIELSGMSYDRRSGVLKFNASASELSSLPRFVEQMRTSGLFSDVQYRGYVQTRTGAVPLTGSGLTATTNPGSTGSSGGSNRSGVLTPTNTAVPAAEIISYYYTLECLCTAPVPALPVVPSKAPAAPANQDFGGSDNPGGAASPDNSGDPNAAQGGA